MITSRTAMPVHHYLTGLMEINLETESVRLDAQFWTLNQQPARAGFVPIADVVALMHPDHREKAINHLYQLKEESSVTVGQVIGFQPGSEPETHILFMAFNQPGQAIAPGCFCCLDPLITNARRLSDQNQLLNMMLTGANVGLFDWNLETNELVWSPKVFQMLGYEPGAVSNDIEFVTRELLHPDDHDRLMGAVQRHLDEGGPLQVDERMLCADGTWRWVSMTACAARDENGKAIRLCGSLLDIHQLVTDQEQLEASQAVLDIACDMGNFGGWEFNVAAKTSIWSDSLYNIYEMGPEYRGIKVKGTSYFDTEAAERLDQAVQTALTEGTPWVVELPMTTVKGNRRITRSVGKVFRNDQGDIVTLAGTLQDITEEKSRELELQHSLALVGEQNKRLQNFAQLVNHHLRSQTDHLQMLADTLGQSTDEDAYAQLANQLNEASTQLHDTLAEMNQVVQVQAHIDLGQRIVDLQELVGRLTTLHALQLEELNATVETQLDCPELLLVPTYLESIFHNLLTNSLKYRHPQVPLHITIRCAIEKGAPVLTFADNGLGIDLKQHGHELFGMYQTFHRNSDARGLGLFITKNQVEAMGGTIAVESQPGRGTTMRITWPVTALTTPAEATTQHLQDPA